MQLLYQRDFTKQSPKDTLPLFHAHFGKPQGSDDFASALVQGVEEHREEIDRLIGKHTEHWTLDRMSRVDHNILRVAVFELLWCQDIPPKVSINEAIELGKKFSTEKSAMFINGVLDKISHREQ